MKKLMFANVMIALLTMVSVSAFADNGSWNVDANGLWTAPANWTLNVVPGATSGSTTNGDTATFDKSLTGTRTITVDAGRNVLSIYFGNTTSPGYTLNSVGALVLTNNGTIINNATTDNAQNKILSPIQLQNNATFTSNFGSLLQVGSVTGIAGGATLLTLDGSSQANNNLSGAISDGAGGSVAIIKNGAGTWNLAGTNNYSGDTTITAGTLFLSGTLIHTTDVFVNGSTAIFDLATAETVGKVTLQNGGRIKGSALTSTQAYDMQKGTVDSVLAGTLGLNKTTTKIVNLNGANTYDGATVVSGGILHIENGSALGNTGAGNGTTVANNAELQISRSITILAEALTLTGQGAGTDTGALRSILGTNIYTGQITLDGAARINSDSGTLRLNNAGAITGSHSSDGLTIGGAGDTIISSSIATGSGTLTKDGDGILTLNGDNSYTGLTTITDGKVMLGNANGLGTTDAGTTVLIDAALDLNGQTVGAEAVTLNGTGVELGGGALSNGSSAAASLSGLVTLASDSTITSAGTGGLTFTGGIEENGKTLTLNGVTGAGAINVNSVISGAANSNLVVDNVTVNLNAATANTYNGSTAIINGGTLNANAAVALPTSGGRTAVSMDQVGSGRSTLALGVNQSIASLTGDTTSLANLNANNLTIGAAAGTTTFVGVISGAGGGSLTKDGANTLTLSGFNTYTGKTIIADGTLSINNVSAIATDNQSLGINAVVDLGVVGTSSGILNYTGAVGTLAKDINVLGNGLDTIQNAGSGLLTLSGAVAKNGAVLTLKGGSNGINVTGSISGSSVNSDLIIDGGTTTLSAANSYNGPTFIINGATLNANVANALPTPSRTAVSMDQTGGGTSTLALGADQFIASLVGATNSLVNLNANNLTIGTTGGAATFAGVISGAGDLTTDGTGILTLGGVNLYTGATMIGSGSTLALNTTGTIAASSGVANEGAFTIAANKTIDSMTGAGLTTLGANTLTIGDASNTSSTYTGVASGTGGLTTGGTGTLTLGGVNLYTGATTIGSGSTLALNTSGTIAASSGVANNGIFTLPPTRPSIQ